MDYAQESLKLHYQWRGKLDTVPKMEVKDREALSLAYTPAWKFKRISARVMS